MTWGGSPGTNPTLSATHSLSPARDGAGRGLTATILATFAVGCPICNKLVVAVLGVSGALTYWAPLQPVVGILSLLLLATGLLLRLGGDIACAGRGRSPA